MNGRIVDIQSAMAENRQGKKRKKKKKTERETRTHQEMR